MPDKKHLYKQSLKSPPCWEVLRKPMMQAAMIQASYSTVYHAHSCDIIVINTRPLLCL